MMKMYKGVILAVAVALFAQPVFAATANLEGLVKRPSSEVVSTKKATVLTQPVSFSSRTGESKTVSSIYANRDEYVPGEVLVKYKKNKINLETTAGRISASNFNKTKSIEKKEDLRKDNIFILKIKDGKTVEQKIAELKNDPSVEYVEPNYKRYPVDINSNDTSKDLLWGLDNTGQPVNGVSGINNADINAPEAWAISETTTSAPVIVAVIDSGVAYNHPDLIASMWDGSSCTGVDSIGNPISGGCNHGYDFEDNDKTPLPTTSSHGTHVAGTITATKNNNKGIIGVAPHAKIMALKYDYSVATEVKAIDFAIQNGAKVINASYGEDAYSQAEFDAIRRFQAAGGLFVTAAGNGANDNGVAVDNDSRPSYPCNYNLSNVICVTATDQNDALASFSNYGVTSVDVGAPGTNIYSTVADTNILNETFVSSGLPTGWVKGGTLNNWRIVNVGDSVGNVLYGDLSSPYANNADSFVTSPTYNLSGNTSGATFSFVTKCDTEYTPGTWSDYMQLEYSADGVNFDPYERWDEATLDSLNGDSNSSGGAGYSFHDLPIPSQYLSNDFKFRFRWVTNSSDNNYGGCFVGNIYLNKISDGSDGKYEYKTGTSMATPYVAGLAALIEGYNPNLTASQVKNIILTSGDSLPSLAGKTVSGKRIDAQKALQAATPRSSTKAITSFSFTNLTATGVIHGTGITLHVPFGTVLTALAPTIVTTGVSVSPASGSTQDFTSPVTYTVTAADSSAQSYTVSVLAASPSVLTALTSAIATAQSAYNNAVEGINHAQYSGSSKATLLSAITTAIAITAASSQSDVGTAVVTLNAAVDAFTASVVPTPVTATLIVGSGSSNSLSGAALEVAPTVVLPVPLETPTTPAQVRALGAAAYNFADNLTLGSTGEDVTALQQFLLDNGFDVPAGATGYFGSQTKMAVVAFQKARGITPTSGYVGSLTRAELNKGGTPASTGTGGGLTDAQINAILGLLQSFNADADVIANVRVSLGRAN